MIIYKSKVTTISIVYRELRYFFYKNWYSLYRWHNPEKIEGKLCRFIDLGYITIVFQRKIPPNINYPK